MGRMNPVDPAAPVARASPAPGLASAPALATLLSTLDDVPLRNRLDVTVGHALAALQEIERIHLPQDEFEEHQSGSPIGSRSDLAPQVLAAVQASNRLLSQLMRQFDAPPAAGADTNDADFDLAFDLVDGPTGEGGGLVPPPGPRHEAVPLTLAERAAEAAHAYGGMLRGRIGHFARRLAFALAQNDPWRLLAELDDNKHRLAKAVQGVLFGMVAVFAPDLRREDILPAYRSAVREAVQLRSTLVELGHHVGRCNAALARVDAATAVPLMVALADRLARFCARPAYRSLRAEDKRALIDFRASLYRLRQRAEGPDLALLRQQVEGFAKFLESLHAINHREVLAVHDRLRLQEARTLLQHAASRLDLGVACTELDSAVQGLAAVQGRSPDLDAARRQYAPVAADALQPVLRRWQAEVDAALLSL